MNRTCIRIHVIYYCSMAVLIGNLAIRVGLVLELAGPWCRTHLSTFFILIYVYISSVWIYNIFFISAPFAGKSFPTETSARGSTEEPCTFCALWIWPFTRKIGFAKCTKSVKKVYNKCAKSVQKVCTKCTTNVKYQVFRTFWILAPELGRGQNRSRSEIQSAKK